jgi:hypothetical protein
MQDIPEEIAAHSDTSSWDNGKPRLPGSSCQYLEVDHGPAAESLANKAKGESSQNIVPELHLSSDQDPSPKVMAGKGLDESLETNSPATQSASDIGQRSRLKTQQKSHSFPQESKTNKPAGILRRMTSSFSGGLSSFSKSGRSILPLQKHLRRFKEDYLVSASARSFRYGGLSWSTRLKLWLKDLVD